LLNEYNQINAVNWRSSL